MSRADVLERATGLAGCFAVRAAEYDRTASFPAADIEAIRSEGLLGLMVPDRLGGMGCGFEDYVGVAATLAQGSGATALLLTISGGRQASPRPLRSVPA